MPDATTEHGEGVTQGIVNDPLKLSNAALVNNSVQKKLLLAAQRTPRFLFRAFRSDSDKRCENTLSHVYPLVLQNEAPLIMFDIPKRTLADHALHHLKNRPSPSIFSDWTHSLHCALEKAYELSRNSTQENCNTCLAVIDIKRLPSHIIALHSSAFKVIDKRIPKVPTTKHKFLIYGRIQGSAYKAVPFRRLLPDGFNWSAASMESALDPELELRLAKDFGQLFGAYFKLPVTAMLLAGYKENGDVLKDPERMEFLVRALQNFDVPAEWTTDATIMGKDAIIARYKDVSRTIRLLRALVVAQFGEQDPLPARAGTSNPGLLELLKGSGHGGQGQGDEDEDDFPTSSETSSDQSDLSADEEVAGPALPPGVMDVETKRSIQEALKRTPRYLFRHWNNDADRPSGGYEGLNTVDAITPLAYFRGQGSDSIYDLTREELTTMVEWHLRGGAMLTELSSWTSSLAFCLLLALQTGADAFISIIDTKLLPVNTIVYVPSLEFLNHRFCHYDHEYLAHGVIRGPAHRAALAGELQKALTTLFAQRLHFDSAALSPWNITLMSREMVMTARKVGELYEAPFVVPVTVALLTDLPFGEPSGEPHFKRYLEFIIEGLMGYKIPRRLCADASILTDIVYTEGYNEVGRMILVLRALVDHYHGRGARSRARSPSRPQTYVRRSSLARTGGYQFNRRRSSISNA
ncbi:hypothetical protein KC340_g11836 [Hortaea werneckii]|nr:hypothetical protein KC342_g12140 [Hortaea werneckii]KAI7079649.1 hypothetical protein KC339_g13570 [Hortaea werneckii]KAI7227247.1 hypothetical protein KC365_g9000 [Hortaea werneckii]KAI7305972.1 hypothetical protein KC340_g11836 [Hortaea werneckii]KAI7377055.1 hypothetical protein KC328_g14604 [Hortaea werneckii]